MAESPEWDPHATWFQEQELVMTDSTGNICDRPVGWSTKRLVATVCSVSSQASQPDSDFGLALEWMVQVKSFVVVASEHAYINEKFQERATHFCYATGEELGCGFCCS